MTNRRNFITGTAALTGLGLPLSGLAQATLETAKIVVGFPPGGTADAISRRIAEKLRGSYATNVIVENKPGAGGQIAVSHAKDSAADGSTLLITPSSMLSIYPYTYPKLPYKPSEDLQPVSIACYFNHVFSVGPMVPLNVTTFKDFLSWAKANPEKASYGSPAAGSMAHLIVALALKLTGVSAQHVPYRGSAPGIQDVIGGQIAAMSCPIGDCLPHLKSGRLRLLAISGINRSPFVPDVATFRQQGLPITVREWYGIFLPGKASVQTARRAAAYLQIALSRPDVVTGMAAFGMEVRPSSSQTLADLMQADSEEWRRLIKQIGFTADS